MLSYKTPQNMQPLYSYYVETDLDNLLDDQVVDFSKKYSDQDYEVCRESSKSSNETLQVPSQTTHSLAVSDEVKVYCLEGTPLAISSASSFCDLRDIGTTNLDTPETDPLTEPCVKPRFTSSNDNDNLKEAYETKQINEVESLGSGATNQNKEKEELNLKEDKSVTFRNEDDISKASSPLMFSRSSSVCSLNSFEQHSIVDDRSSVSAFSTLASGIISPSDLPDSPGEGMFTDSQKTETILIACHKNGISKDVSGNESDNVLEMHGEDEISNQDCVEKKDPLPGLSWAELNTAKDTDKEKKLLKSEHFDTDENNVLMQHCIQLGMPNTVIPESNDEMITNDDYQMHSTPFSDEKVMEQELIKSGDESEGDDILVQECIKLGMPANVSKSDPAPKADFEVHSESFIKNGRMYDMVKSDDDSDADENILVQRCIQLGMPKKRSKMDVKPQILTGAQYQPHLGGMEARKTFRDNCPDGISQSDGSGDDEDDDELLAKCIFAGMPSPKTVDAPKTQPISSNRTVTQNSEDSKNTFIVEKKGDCGKKYSSHLPQNPIYAPVNNRTTWITNSSFIEVDSMRIYQTEDTPLLSPSASVSDLSSLSFSEDKNCHEGYLNNSRNSDCSSESEDDELLLQCIRSGMPGAKRAVA